MLHFDTPSNPACCRCLESCQGGGGWIRLFRSFCMAEDVKSVGWAYVKISTPGNHHICSLVFWIHFPDLSGPARCARMW